MSDYCEFCDEVIENCTCDLEECEECGNLLEDCICDLDLEGYEIDGEAENRREREFFDGEEETYRNDEGD